MRKLAVFAIGLMMSGLTLHAADISGIWMGSLAGGRRNTVQDFAFQFIQKDGILTGKQYLDYGSTPILKGTVDGDKIAFQIVAREQAGKAINQTVPRFPRILKHSPT